MLLGEEPLGEGLLVETGRIPHIREAVEGAARLEAVQAHLVESPGHQDAPPVVFREHLLDEGLAGADGLHGGVLGRGGGAHDPVLVHLGDAGHDLRRRRDVADAPARHRVGLAEAADQHRPLAHPIEGAEGDVLVAAIDEAVVDLVGDDHEVVTLGDRGDGG